MTYHLSESEIKSLLIGKWNCVNTSDKWTIEFKNDSEYDMTAKLARDKLETIIEQFRWYLTGDVIKGLWWLRGNIIEQKPREYKNSNYKTVLTFATLGVGTVMGLTLSPLLGVSVGLFAILGEITKITDKVVTIIEPLTMYLGSRKVECEIIYIDKNTLQIKYSGMSVIYEFEKISNT